MVVVNLRIEIKEVSKELWTIDDPYGMKIEFALLNWSCGLAFV
jgi:hypothetical protein